MKVTLTESQINKLIKGYKVLNEQSEGGFNQRTETKSIDLGTTFDSGKWKLTASVMNTLQEKIRPLVSFLESNPSSDVKITIVAGESQVTNYDREKCGNGIYTQECKLKPKQLSQLRAQEIKKELNKVFVGLKTKGTIPKLPTEPTIKTVLGSTKYTPGTDKPDDPKYKKEQKIELLIDAEASYGCLVGMNITISYEGEGGHNCDESIFNVRLNGVSLGVANLNNGKLDVGSVERLRKKIKQYNAKFQEKSSAKYMEFRNELKTYGPKSDKYPRRNGLLLKDYEINGQTLESLGFPYSSSGEIYGKGGKKTWDKYLAVLRNQSMMLVGGISYTRKTIVDESLVKKMEGLYDFSEKDMGKPITDVRRHRSGIQQRLLSMKGRETDKKPGGIRRQTFQLDQSIAKSIVDGGKIKDRLELSIRPLVSKTGPYKEFFRSGSHSDVPTVKITNGKGDELYNGNPNVSMNRGSLKPKLLLRTDLCGNPLKS
jgi:hypothetical protein